MTEEQKPKSGMLGKGCLIIGGVLLGLIVIGVVVGGDDAGTADQSAPVGPPIAVSSTDLSQAYADNEVAAQQKYGSSPLLVSGRVESIELDFADDPIVNLTAHEEFTYVIANFAGDATAATSQLKKGQEITLLCKGISEVIGSPILKGCAIQ